MIFFSGAEVANSFKHVLDEMEEFKGRGNMSDWLTKKGLQRNFGCAIRLCHTIE